MTRVVDRSEPAAPFSAADEKWMDRALGLALRGRGTTRPNPIVGAVLVRNGRLLAEGFHRRAGLPHAEREALSALGTGQARARGATLYVTLEPCCHTGRTPPCTDALIAAGIARVVVGVRDPNPAVDGEGIARLRRAGIRVDVGCRAAEARAQNRPFLTWVQHGRPWVTLKVASTLDGFIADWSMPTTRPPAPGPVWLTGEEARRAAHLLRSEHDAILVGAGTVLADDPQLTVRLGAKPPPPPPRPAGSAAAARRRSPTRKGAGRPLVEAAARAGAAELVVRQPLRVVLDGRLRISPGARILRATGGNGAAHADPGGPRSRPRPGPRPGAGAEEAPETRTLVFGAAMAPRHKALALEAAGAEVIRMPGQGSRVHLGEVLQVLATRGIQSVLVEGGADVHAAFIAAGLVDGVAMFQAPLLLGGGVPVARGQGRGVPAALRLGPLDVQRFGEDLCIRAEVLR